jgi:hypothetical protein
MPAFFAVDEGRGFDDLVDGDVTRDVIFHGMRRAEGVGLRSETARATLTPIECCEIVIEINYKFFIPC